MLQLVLYALLAIAIAAALFGLAARFLPAGEQIAPPLRDEPPWELPAGRALQPTDVDEVRLPVALRGYRFAETDVLLDRLATELRQRDAEIARLRGDPTEPGPFTQPPDSDDTDDFDDPADPADSAVPIEPVEPADPAGSPVADEAFAPPPGNPYSDAETPPPGGG